MDRLIFGSVAAKVVRLAKCHVLTVTGQPEKGESSVSIRNVKPPEEKSEKNAYLERIGAQLKVGIISNMYDIAQSLIDADRFIRP